MPCVAERVRNRKGAQHQLVATVAKVVRGLKRKSCLLLLRVAVHVFLTAIPTKVVHDSLKMQSGTEPRGTGVARCIVRGSQETKEESMYGA